VSARARWLVGALSGAALVVLCGCGISNDKGPRDIAARDQPFPLVSNPQSPDTTAASGGPKVYLVSTDDSHLIGSARDAANRDDLVRALLQGPTQQDQQRGLRSFVPIGTTLVRTELDAAGVLTIRLKLAADSLGFRGADAAKGFAQLVFTVTDNPGVLGVRFVVDDQPIQPLNGDGTRVDTPVTRADYAKLAPISFPDVHTPGAVASTTTEAPTTFATTPPPTTGPPTTGPPATGPPTTPRPPAGGPPTTRR